MKYSPDLAVSLDDFLVSSAPQIIESFYKEAVHHERQLDNEFAIAANEASEASMYKQAKVLWLLSYAASLYLNHESLNEPLRPFWLGSDGWRSALIEDFSRADIELFAAILSELPNCLFKARLADIVWLRQRDIKAAIIAIGSYQAPLTDFLSWIHGGSDAWRRACTLALQLGKAAAVQIQNLEAGLLKAFDIGLKDNGFLSNQVATLLQEKRLANEHAEAIAKGLFLLAEKHFQIAEFFHAEKHFEQASLWFEKSKNREQALAAKVRRAESLASEAQARTEGSNGSYLGAQSLFDKAIQAYQEIPNSERSAYDVDNSIVQLRARMIEVGQKSRAEMQSIPISIDRDVLEKLAEYAQESVAGKKAIDALISFVLLNGTEDFATKQQKAINELKNSLAFLITGGSQTISIDGRVIASNKNSNKGAEPSESAVLVQMIRTHVISSGLRAHSLMAALHTLRIEHRLTQDFFNRLVSEASTIPSDRVSLFARGLFAGYDGDFVVSTHLLIPQIEHFVRIHLKQVGAITTTHDREGVTHENGLSTLIDLPQAVQVFGESLVFDFRALLCDSNGPNLRNELAHGLLDANGCQSPAAVYFWWVCLRLIVTSWWNVIHPAKSDESN